VRRALGDVHRAADAIGDGVRELHALSGRAATLAGELGPQGASAPRPPAGA